MARSARWLSAVMKCAQASAKRMQGAAVVGGRIYFSQLGRFLSSLQISGRQHMVEKREQRKTPKILAGEWRAEFWGPDIAPR